MTSRFGMLAAMACVTLSSTALAQGTATGSVPAARTPQVIVSGLTAVTSLANWPGLQLSVNRDAYVTVFAVTRTKGSALPIQILSPTQPHGTGKVKAGKIVAPRRLLGDEAMHLLNYGESPLIVAFASAVKPELSAFTAGERWGHDLLLDTLAGSEQQMVEILAKTIYAAGVPFDAVVSAPSALTPVPTIADAFSFTHGPITFARFATSITGRIEASLDPVIMTADVYQKSGMLPQGSISGAPFTLKGGATAAIEQGRIVYLPPPPKPPTAEQLGKQGGGGPGTAPPPPPPR